MTKIKLGKVAGLELSARPSAIVGFILLWVLLGGVAALLFKVPLGEAIVGGFIAVVLHYVSEIVHNLGHAWAARRTGYPMIGVRLFGVLGVSLYPQDEPPLPADVHIRRALGGPAASLLLTLVAGAIALALRPSAALGAGPSTVLRAGLLGKTPWLVAVFCFLENLLVFTLGAFLPLGFTDGSTLLEWWGKR
jgi:hypothetical protein